MNFLLRVNGMDAPLMRQLGCLCERCRDGRRQANVSVSVFGLEDVGQTAVHILFDIGAGVTDSLVDTPYLVGFQARLDWLCLTHWHPDHTLEMNRLLSAHRSVKRRETGQPTGRIPLWCRRATALWLQKEHSFDWQHQLEPHVPDENHPPGTLLAPLPLPTDWGLTITPVTTSHYTADLHPDHKTQLVYACAGFVVETAVSKAALLWDLDSSNDWLTNPADEREETAVSRLRHADYLFIDTSFWHAKPQRSTHPSFENVRRIARNLQPRHTLLMHLSGHPDGVGKGAWGWTNGRWQHEAQAVWQAEQLPGTVAVPNIGDEFNLSNPNLSEIIK
jgi:ribonuclease BN (tRNA processing enzyme)